MNNIYHLNSTKKLPINTQKKDYTEFTNLNGASTSYILTKLHKQFGRPLIIFCENNNLCQAAESELNFFAPDLEVLNFPDWEILPYDRFSPQKAIISERLLTLKKLSNLQNGVLLINASTALQRLAPITYINGSIFDIKVGMNLSLSDLATSLIKAGYEKVSSVYESGSFAQRGGILDFFPMGSKQAFRIEWFDDEIESIRSIDTQTQRSLEQLEKIEILPAQEYAFNQMSRDLFLENFQTKLSANLAKCEVYNAVKQAQSLAGLEFYLPLFFKNTNTIFDYLPTDSLVVQYGDLAKTSREFSDKVQKRYDSLAGSLYNPILAPKELYLTEDEFLASFNNWQNIIFKTKGQKNTEIENNEKRLGVLGVDFATLELEQVVQREFSSREARIEHLLNLTPNAKLITAYNAGRLQRIVRQLEKQKFVVKQVQSWREFLESKAQLAICVSDCDRCFAMQAPTSKDEFSFDVLHESLLFNEVKQAPQKRSFIAKSGNQNFIKSLNELSPGCKVVHMEHGIGIFCGLESLQTSGYEQDFVKIQYANNSVLYIPIADLDKISRYSSLAEDATPLSVLGNSKWQKDKAKAEKKIYDTAAELLHIQARRFSKNTKAFSIDEEEYLNFVAGFKFEETADQKRAINEVIEDLTQAKPMDRVICGDVGFGKTEIALRAAYIAAANGKQVAVLAPTTLLAEQHFELFSDRFSKTPIRVASLSRFKTAKQQKGVIENLQDGKIDIVIGTHKILQPSVKFDDLGLLIIDEEHRFGVGQKETIKKLRAEVNLLTLTATPIPRTLNMALGGIRDLSIIATPPQKRLSIKTFMRQYDSQIIEEAVQRELMRGGQIYFLHNEVQDILNKKEELQALMPDVSIGVAHGQMRERELEAVMLDFYQHKYQILLCTTIIENGIDVPSANTIIIERADKLGLAQLHQLRGRVGRSHHQAYAYLLTPKYANLTKDATARLEAIVNANELGSGFVLASQDLEIRGSGSLLGEEQSGQMDSIGFNLYIRMLDKAVKAIKAGKLPDANIEPKVEVDINASALLPQTYISEINLRLDFYTRLADANLDEIMQIELELEDRFGKLPEPTQNLIKTRRIAVQAQSLGIKKIDVNAKGCNIDFEQDAKINIQKLVELVQSSPKSFKLRLTKLVYTGNLEEVEARFNFIQNLFEKLEVRD